LGWGRIEVERNKSARLVFVKKGYSSTFFRKLSSCNAMAIEPYDGISPEIHDSAFIAASADVIGRVKVGENASIWYNATVRGDINDIEIGARSNIQDNAVLHLADDYGVKIGEDVTIGHGLFWEVQLKL